MPQAPKWFLDELKAFDPDLRLRWSERRDLWQLERRVRRSAHPGTTLGDTEADDYIRARDGFILVASIPPRGLHRYVFSRLRAADLWSRGGWKRVADDLDAMEAAEEEHRWEAISRENQAVARDLYNIIAVREGRAVYNVGHP